MNYEEIKRPESTTYVVKELFHLIKDKTELENILADLENGFKDERVFLCGRGMDTATWQPLIYFAIKPVNPHVTPFNEWPKYVGRLEFIVAE